MKHILTPLYICLILLSASINSKAFTMDAPESWPGSLSFQNWSLDTTVKGNIDMSTGSWSRTDVLEVPGFIRMVTYERPDPDGLGGKTTVQFKQFAWSPNYQVEVGSTATGDPNSPLFNATYNGPSLNELNFTGGGVNFYPPPANLFNTQPANLTASNFVNGLSSSGNMPTGGNPASTVDSNAAVIAEQAQQLNVGLEFNNGQWVPSQ